MATYVNNLRLKEIATGDESGTWGTSTNTNLELITDGFSYGTKEMAADANETFTMPDATADATRSLYLKFTSAVSLTQLVKLRLGQTRYPRRGSLRTLLQVARSSRSSRVLVLQ
jgi:hypothetical protein